MGCAQTKYFVDSPDHYHHHERGLEKLKLENDYVKGGHAGVPVVRKQHGKVDDAAGKTHHEDGSNRKKVVGHGPGRGVANGGGDRPPKERININGGDGRGDKDVTVLKKVQRPNVTAKKYIGGYDIVNGWPKWLVDNISGDVLAGWVPKTADSFEKLAKVIS